MPVTLPPGLSRDIVARISEEKKEPLWMRDFRLAALARYESMPMPTWGADLRELVDQDIHYYVRAHDEQHRTWDDVPDAVRTTFETLGIPAAERNYLAGVGAQFESEVIYKSLKDEWRAQGVVFADCSTGLREHEEIFKRYFATIVPPHDNKFAALNSAVWSGGSFVYVPRGVHVTMPLQAYFRIERSQMGQFERTLIVVEPGGSVHYVEGCSAPLYSRASLHSAVVEIVALEGASVTYTTIQNWASNVYNLVTKRAVAYKNARMVWVDGNFGSKVTMKYPAVILKEPGAHGEVISLAVARAGQHQDSGAKMIHCAPHTTSRVIAKSLSSDGGRSSYRGLVKVIPGAHSIVSRVQCDALMLDAQSRADTYPTIECREPNVDIGHEASVGKVGEEQLLFLMSRGLSRQAAQGLIVRGFVEPLVSLLPMEYAVEINRLILHDMDGSIG